MKGDQMGILAAYPTQRELPLSNQTRFSCLVAERYWDAVAWAIEEYAWRFEALMSPPDVPAENTGGL